MVSWLSVNHRIGATKHTGPEIHWKGRLGDTVDFNAVILAGPIDRSQHRPERGSNMSTANVVRRLPLLLAGCVFLFASSAGSVLAQGAPAGRAGRRHREHPKRTTGRISNAASAKAGLRQQRAGSSQLQSGGESGCRLVEKWIETINHDTDGHMALIDDNILVRGDPTEKLRHGPGRLLLDVPARSRQSHR